MHTSFPSAAEIEAATPPDRDRALDVIRIAALIGVVVGHTVMATSVIADGVLHWDNLLTTSVVFQAATWVFQIMPLFFFAGVAASVGSYRPGTAWGGWLLRRCTRLYRPVFAYLAFWAVALVLLRPIVGVHVYEPVAGISVQLLWFLGAYVLVLAAMPLLVRVTSAPRLWFGLAAVYALVAVVDHLRLGGQLPPVFAYANLAAWSIPGLFGVAYRRGLLRRRAALGVAAAAFAVNLALLRWGPYELSLVGIETQRLKNMSPPSLLLAGHAIALCALAIAAAPAVARWARRPRVWRATVIGNTGAMTLYLWHMPILLFVHLVFDGAGLPRYPGYPHFVALGIVQTLLVATGVGIAFLTLRPLENGVLPGWDGGVVPSRGPRSALVGALLCVAAAATLASVGWGLKEQGLYCIAVMLGALLAARACAATRLPAPAG